MQIYTQLYQRVPILSLKNCASNFAPFQYRKFGGTYLRHLLASGYIFVNVLLLASHQSFSPLFKPLT